MTVTDHSLTRAQPALAAWQPRGRLQRLLETMGPLLRRPGFMLAAAVVLFALLAALSPGLFSSIDPYATVPAAKLLAPGVGHWFGTDELGRDLYTRMLYGARLSILAALLAVGLALVSGLGL
ncbi:MAG: ABC transporter permease, partial [Pseudomonas sp.]